MRGAWILTSTWEAIRLAVALAGSVVLGSFPNPVSAQALPLTLKLSPRLADSPVVHQGKAVRRTRATAAVPGLRLALSPDLTITSSADTGPASAPAAGPPASSGGTPALPASKPNTKREKNP